MGSVGTRDADAITAKGQLTVSGLPFVQAAVPAQLWAPLEPEVPVFITTKGQLTVSGFAFLGLEVRCPRNAGSVGTRDARVYYS